MHDFFIPTCKNPRPKTGGFLLPKGALCAKISTGRDTNDGKAAPPAKGVVICALHTKT